jgi:integrase
MQALDVERWLKSLPLAPNSKSHLRNFMHLLFEWARRWQLIDKNEVELVRQGKRRQKTPRRLSADEFQRLLGYLQEPCRTMAILAACLGLRVGEILGLQWGDVELLNKTLTIRRSVCQYHVGPAKTPNSEAALPLAPEIVSVLQKWLSQTMYRTEGDWVFASHKGTLMDGDKLRERFLQPAAAQAKIGKIGWHSLRHSFATALDSTGARLKVAQELMRHANISTTMDVYTGAMERDKREAASQVARSFLGAVQ